MTKGIKIKPKMILAIQSSYWKVIISNKIMPAQTYIKTRVILATFYFLIIYYALFPFALSSQFFSLLQGYLRKANSTFHWIEMLFFKLQIFFKSKWANTNSNW